MQANSTQADSTRLFLPLEIAILTISDSRSLEEDGSGQLLADRVSAAGHRVAARSMVRDEVDAIETALRLWIGSGAVNVILTTGGTGITGRDVTPEAVSRVLEKEIPGFGEMFRWISFQKMGTAAMLSRAIGGVTQGVYIFALPGSPAAVADAWDSLLQPQLDNRTEPGNLVRLLPRLMEGIV